MNIERFSLESLKPHPLNAKIYGAAEPDNALIESIEAVGVLNAIIVDQKGRILSGTRRWKACKALAERHGNEKFSQIPTEVFKGNDLEAQRRLIHANRQRDKTLEQKSREYRELLRLETESAKQRKLANLKKGPKKPEWEIFPTRGRAGDIAAKATGLNAKTLDKFLKVVEAAEAGPGVAQLAYGAGCSAANAQRLAGSVVSADVRLVHRQELRRTTQRLGTRPRQGYPCLQIRRVVNKRERSNPPVRPICQLCRSL